MDVSANGADIVAAGSFSGGIGLFDTRDTCSSPSTAIISSSNRELGGTGVTQVLFSKDGLQLYAGLRQSNDILVWDLRNTCQPAHRIVRKSMTNQRLYFDLDSTGTLLATGSTDGSFDVVGLDATTMMHQSGAHRGKSPHSRVA